MNIDELFTDKYTPEERRLLWRKEFFRRGLYFCGGSRKQAAAFLGYTIRGLRNIINREFPDLWKEFPNQGRHAKLVEYQQKKSEYLHTVKEYWLPSKKAAINKELRKIADDLGLDDSHIL